MVTSYKLEGLDWTLYEIFSVESSATLQLALSLAVGSPSSKVSKVLSDLIHSNCPSNWTPARIMTEVPFHQTFQYKITTKYLKKFNPFCELVFRLFHQTNSRNVTFDRLQLSGKFLVIFIKMYPSL